MTNFMCHPRVLSSSPVRQAQDRLRRGSMHLVLSLILAAFFVACSDNDSDVTTPPSDDSSSSVCNDCEDGSSSSVTPQSSSSSKVPEPVEGSSSSTISSSSSVTLATPCKTETEDNCEYGELTDDRDGKKYKTVKIGDQVWMAENLNYAGGGIGHCYEDVPENCEAGGRLYKWDVAREVCPEGWHLPSKEEFETLLDAVKLVYDEYDKAQYSFADMFKATSGWKNDYTSWTQGLDKVGFSAVPAGGKHVEGYRAPEYNFAGSAAFFLTSTEHSADEVYIMQLNLEVFSDDSYEYGVSLVYDYELTQLDGWPHYNTKESEFSVRCLKDAE